MMDSSVSVAWEISASSAGPTPRGLFLPVPLTCLNSPAILHWLGACVSGRKMPEQVALWCIQDG
jgi:hypothetical protein